MKTKLIACAALLMAACCGSPSARKAAATKTEVKHGPEIVLAAPDTVGGTSVNEALANSIVAQLLFLEMEDPDADISMYINSPGGSVTDGMAIFDTMRYIKPKVRTVCLGMAASMGAFPLMAGAPGLRLALPPSEVMIHQPSGGASGQATDVQLHAQWLLRTKGKMNKLMSEMTHQPLERIERDVERDYFMTAEEALAYGIIDEIYQPRKK